MDYIEKLKKDMEQQKELIAKLEAAMDSVPEDQKATQASTLKLLRDNLEHMAASLATLQAL